MHKVSKSINVTMNCKLIKNTQIYNFFITIFNNYNKCLHPSMSFLESIDFNEILYTIYSDLYSNIIFYSLLLYIFDYN